MIGIWSALGFFVSMVVAVPILEFLVSHPGWIDKDSTGQLLILFLSPVGHLLVANFCLRRWTSVEQREGVRACNMVLLAVLVFGVVGTVISAIYSNGETDVFGFASMSGFWTLWGFALASVIRKLRRMKRAANAD